MMNTETKVVIGVMLFTLVVTSLFVYNQLHIDNYKEKVVNRAYIYTADLGCLPTTLTVDEFDAQQAMYHDLFNKNYMRCK